jgi:hypothetical protein
MPLGFNLAVENFVYSEGTMTQTQVVNNANVAFLDISNAADTAVKYRGADVSSSDDLGEVTVSVRELAEDEHCTTDGSASPAYARRCYEITAENDLPATVRLWSLLTDLNDIPVTSLSVYRRVPPNWVELTVNRTTGTDGASYAYAEGDTPGFSYFLLGQQGLAPTAVTLLPLSTSQNIPITIFPLFILLSALTVTTWYRHKKYSA